MIRKVERAAITVAVNFRMKTALPIATFLLVGAGIAGIGALNPLESPLQGSDTLFNVTQDAISALSAQGLDIGPADAYIGGGSGNGQSALVAGTQHIAPMSRMLDRGVCTTNTTNASGIVIGLDGVDVYGSTFDAGGPADPGSCNSAGNGFAFDGVNGQGFANYKNVLALVYGGLDNTTGTVDCNSAKRISVVNNWSALFENSCTNNDPTCNNTAHGGNTVCSVGGAFCAIPGAACNTTGVCVNRNPVRLWHAFRRDDASSTSDVFASILGLTPNTSASLVHGFGTSPYCNALNWDTSLANANCLMGAGKQFIGPGGVRQGFCSGSPTQPCVIGAAHCDAASVPISNIGQRCDPLLNACGGSGQCVVDNAPCAAGQVCQPLAGDSHRRPPLNTWGDDPDPNTNPRGENDADVLPTSFQDNDPIRRTCIGSAVYTVSRDGEEVCNRDGTLGLVIPVPATDFVDVLPDPNHPGQLLVQYAMNFCNDFVLGAATRVFSCAPRASTHPGECPNGDQTFGAGHTCEVPIDRTNNTSQCQQAKTAAPGLGSCPAPASSDYRFFNEHLRDGSTVDGFVPYITQNIPTMPASPSRDFAGAFNRIHQVATIPAVGPGKVGGCTLKDSTDQIACFTHADRCSIGYAGEGGNTYSTRYANGKCLIGGAPCSINGDPYTCPGGIANCIVAAQSGAPSAPILVNKVLPSPETIQALGNGATEYPLARKLYLNSLDFNAGVDDAGNASDGAFDSGITASELQLAKFESTPGTVGICTAGVCSVGGAACAPDGAPCAGAAPASWDGINPILVNEGFFILGSQSPQAPNTPFCEDFNAGIVCDAGFVNDNACSRMPANLIINGSSVGGLPGDPSAAPDANTTSTVCGNGKVDAFEECDPADPSTWHCSVPGAVACSNTCRC